MTHRKNKKRIFILTTQQWCGLVILLLIGTGILALLHYKSPPPSETKILNDSTRHQMTRYQAHNDSVYKSRWKKKHYVDTIQIAPSLFDPNTADSILLRRQGFRAWQAHNILRYREKGGKFRKPKDLKRLSWMTDSIYELVEPYIQITIDTMVYKVRETDSIPRYKSMKRDTIINLRTADTTELKMIRGIGSTRSKAIVRYREQLGGYARIEQILEIPSMRGEGMDSVLSHFIIDTVIVRTLAVNKLRVEQLQRHPYLSFEQAKALYEFRRRKGHLSTIEQLNELKYFDENDFFRLKPYLSFEK